MSRTNPAVSPTEPAASESGDPVTILDRYILRKHVGPFLFAVVTITFLFVMPVLVDFLDLFASRNVDFFTILETFVLSLGTTALYQMGVAPDPQTGAVLPPDPLVAKQHVVVRLA